MTLTKFLYDASVFSVFVPVLSGLIFFKSLDRNSRIMLVLLAFASISQLSSFLSDRDLVSFLKETHDVWRFYNTNIILDSVIWGYLFYTNSRNHSIRIAIITIISIQVAVYIFVYSVEGIASRFFSDFVCLSSLVQLLWVLSYFYERYKREEIRALEKEPMFWFCLGLLIYSPTTYFRFAFYDALSHHPERDRVEIIHDVSNISMYLVFALGMLVNVFPTTKLKNVFVRNRS